MQLNIVLVEPEIPQNSGMCTNMCSNDAGASGEPLGFSVEDRYLKRAGLDYWNDVEVIYHDSFYILKSLYKEAPFYYVSTKAEHVYSDISFPDQCFLVFGKETKGLPEDLLRENHKTCIRIPMLSTIRSLNLANSVSIVTYEFFRQKGFRDFQLYGSID